MVLAVCADLGNMAYKFIAIEKDWFVVVTAGDSGSLASKWGSIMFSFIVQS